MSELPLTELAATLADMPPEWLDSIRQAAIKGADTPILQLVAELPEHQSDLANTLRYWTQNFQFNAILEALPPD